MFYSKDVEKMEINGKEIAKMADVVGAGVYFSFLDSPLKFKNMKD